MILTSNRKDFLKILKDLEITIDGKMNNLIQTMTTLLINLKEWRKTRKSLKLLISRCLFLTPRIGLDNSLEHLLFRWQSKYSNQFLKPLIISNTHLIKLEALKIPVSSHQCHLPFWKISFIGVKIGRNRKNWAEINEWLLPKK